MEVAGGLKFRNYFKFVSLNVLSSEQIERNFKMNLRSVAVFVPLCRKEGKLV